MPRYTKILLYFERSENQGSRRRRGSYIVLALLLIIPLVWLARSSYFQKILPYITSHIASYVSINVPDYRAELIGQSHKSLIMKQGQEIRVWVDFKNKGEKTWTNCGEGLVALDIKNPGKRSLFRTADWDKDHDRYPFRTGRVNEEVKPGETARFYISLRAQVRPGWYEENFGLVSEKEDRIQDGDFSLLIKVIPNNFSSLPEDLGLKVSFALLSAEKLLFTSNDAFEIRDKENNWIALYHKDEVVEVFYKDGKYHLIAPAIVNGEYNPRGWYKTLDSYPRLIPVQDANYIKLANNGQKYQIPIEVHYLKKQKKFRIIKDLSKIRVGAFTPEGPVEISSDGAFEIKGRDNLPVALYHNNEIVTVEYKNGKYYLEAPAMVDGKYDPRGWHKVLDSYPRFVPIEEATFVQIVNQEARPSWNPSLNDNRYRGAIEIRFSQSSERLWAVNELYLEEYLRGIAETSNRSPAEFQKALAVASRTYAQYVLSLGGKHRNEIFHLNTTQYDQVYKGYNFEFRAPNIVKAVYQTSGQMVVYNNEIIVTPYFSRSDGRTRAWAEVWKGERAYLQSVPDPACKGMSLLGHGVGMSGYGALKMAEAGANYDKILKYYYTGIEIKDLY